MKIMNYKWMAVVGAVALMTATSVKANTVSGSIGIDAAKGTTVTIDQTANTVTFVNLLTPTLNASVNQATGDFSALFGQAANYQNFTYSPLSVSNPIWTTAGASFDLITVTSIDEEANALTLFGTGTIHMAGFDDTQGIWSFSATSTAGFFNFEATTTSVPDGGTTVMLLGAGLSGLALVRRKLS